MFLHLAARMLLPWGRPIGCCRIVAQTLLLDVSAMILGIMIPSQSSANCFDASDFVNPLAIVLLVGQYLIAIVPFEILSRV